MGVWYNIVDGSLRRNLFVDVTMYEVLRRKSISFLRKTMKYYEVPYGKQSRK
jgi:hypothetical protein